MTAVSQFLNEKFSSLADLGSLDQVITDIESERKSNQTNGNVNDDPIAKESDKLLEKIELIVNSDIPDIYSVDELIEEYGNLQILVVIKKELLKKEELLEKKSLEELYLAALGKVESFRKELLTIEEKDRIFKELEALNIEIGTFKSKTYNIQNFSLRDSFVHKLDFELSQVIVEELKDKEMASLRSLLSTPFEQIIELHPLIESFTSLLKLQSLDPVNKSNKYPLALWAFQVLTEDFNLKFSYHFQTANALNRLDKPELAFRYIDSYLIKNLENYQSTFSMCLVNTAYANDIFQFHFITALLMPLREKLSHDIQSIENDERQLSHLVFELQKFDELLKSKYKYDPFFVGGDDALLTTHSEWNGLMSDLILSEDHLFTKWLAAEKGFVSHRYDELVSAEDSFIIDYDFAETGKTKPTKSAINLRSLLENITSNYEHLPLKFKLKFLGEVQLKLLDFYYKKLEDGLDALEAHYLKSRNVSTMINVNTVERLCRIWCSIEFMIETMQQWGEQLIFIELWNSLENNNSNLKTAFFDSVIRSYKKLLSKVVDDLEGFLERKLNATMKSYFGIRTWAENKPEEETRELEMSSELQPAIQALSQDIALVQKAISTVSLLSLLQKVSSVVANYFEKNVLKSLRFSRTGAQKLSTDINEFWTQLNLPKDNNMKRLLQLCLILTETTKFKDVQSCRNHFGKKLDLLTDNSISDIILRKV